MDARRQPVHVHGFLLCQHRGLIPIATAATAVVEVVVAVDVADGGGGNRRESFSESQRPANVMKPQIEITAETGQISGSSSNSSSAGVGWMKLGRNFRRTCVATSPQARGF